MTENATRDITAFLRERVVPPGGSRYGLVIGIEQYQDARLNLRCAAGDAKARRNVTDHLLDGMPAPIALFKGRLMCTG